MAPVFDDDEFDFGGDDGEDTKPSRTDDDLPPSLPGRISRGGRVSGNGRATTGAHYGRLTADQQMRKLEQEAYIAVLQAFKAQSDNITWDKEQLMSNLRKELRISDAQHLECIMSVGTNPALRQIRERRPLDEERLALSMYDAPIMDPAAAPVTAPSRKKQKTAHVSQTTLPPPVTKASSLPSPTVAPTAPGKRVPPVGSKGKKTKGGRQQPNVSNLASKSLSIEVPATGRGSALATGRGVGLAGDVFIDPWIGKRVKTRWPADNAFYEAVITDYNPDMGKHALVYEMNTENEAWEWVDLKELSPRDLKVVDGPLVPVTGKGPSGNFGSGGRGSAGRGTKKGGGRGGGLLSPVGRGRTANKGPANSLEKSAPRNWKDSTPENGLETKASRQIQLPSLDALVKEVDKIAEEDDLLKIESIKRAAKEHEEILRKALAEVGESSEEGDSDEEEPPPFSHTRSMDRERERRSRQDSRDRHGDDDDDTAGDGREGSDGEPLVGDGGVASDADDDHQEGDDGDDG